MATELQITPSDISYSSVKNAIGANSGGTDIYVKELTGHASISGLEIDFTIYVSKVGSSISNDIADKTGDYTITIDKA